MRVIKTASEIFIAIFGVTLLYIILNDAEILPWKIMEKIWLFYAAFCGFAIAYIFGKNFSLSGGGLFLSFCFIIPPTLLSYYAALPWGDFFFAPLPIILAGVFSALGEATARLITKAKIEKANKKTAENNLKSQ
ncbi:MAG: hypothetical protein RSH79_02590 [Clostridiales bacterium]